MKQTLILFVFACTLISCKKDYVCTCTDPTRNFQQVGQYTFNERAKTDAELKCLDREIAYTKIAMYQYVDCSIK